MSVLTASIGGYGTYATYRANQIVVDIYDRPLMAINFARSASLTFVQMQADLLRASVVRAPAVLTHLNEQAESFFGDLTVAEQRSMSSAASETAVDIRRRVEEWLAAVQLAASDSTHSSPGSDPSALAGEIVKRFDRLIELSAGDGFRERRRAIGEINATTAFGFGCTVLALILAGLLTFALSRRILRPLSAAASVADRIAKGDFDVKIPPARHDEVGRLLRSMRSMQNSIRTMMDLEAEQRRSAQRRLVNAIEGAQEGMMLVGPDGRIIITNSQMRRFLPLAADYLKPGAQFSEVIARAVPPGTATTANGIADNPTQFLAAEGEVQLGSDLWLKISRGSTGDGGFFLFWSDISVIKERELRLREAKSEAEAASRSKSTFLANMSHELRTPLNAVIGFSEIMVNELYGKIGDSRYKEYATLIARAGRHLLDVISNILDFSKCEAGQMVLHSEPIDLREVIEACVSMVGQQCARSDLVLRSEVPTHPVIILGDAPKLRQILLNLLSNAMKFTPARGEVRVTLAVDLPGCRLSVSDTGIGMRREDIPVALAPFGQVESGLNRSYEGTGLGLPLTKTFAELHGASFEMVSELGEGTTVSLRFPACMGPAKTATSDLKSQVNAAA